VLGKVFTPVWSIEKAAAALLGRFGVSERGPSLTGRCPSLRQSVVWTVAAMPTAARVSAVDVHRVVVRPYGHCGGRFLSRTRAAGQDAESSRLSNTYLKSVG
jgi:hypothetical protein